MIENSLQDPGFLEKHLGDIILVVSIVIAAIITLILDFDIKARYTYPNNIIMIVTAVVLISIAGTILFNTLD
uniref:Uncharacterized protein n=1 Tax=Trichobilharzia regenti TaxID=157069 RepID=A0AA85IVS6_TRIRE|nr:unnamed protein product [Trichobilharzia regenti]